MKKTNHSKLALFTGIITGFIVLLLFFKQMGVDNDTIVIVFAGFSSTVIGIALLMNEKKALK
jgi:hypothetical protein